MDRAPPPPLYPDWQDARNTINFRRPFELHHHFVDSDTPANPPFWTSQIEASVVGLLPQYGVNEVLEILVGRMPCLADERAMEEWRFWLGWKREALARRGNLARGLMGRDGGRVLGRRGMVDPGVSEREIREMGELNRWVQFRIGERGKNGPEVRVETAGQEVERGEQQVNGGGTGQHDAEGENEEAEETLEQGTEVVAVIQNGTTTTSTERVAIAALVQMANP